MPHFLLDSLLDQLLKVGAVEVVCDKALARHNIHIQVLGYHLLHLRLKLLQIVFELLLQLLQLVVVMQIHLARFVQLFSDLILNHIFHQQHELWVLA